LGKEGEDHGSDGSYCRKPLGGARSERSIDHEMNVSEGSDDRQRASSAKNVAESPDLFAQMGTG
jgi:hypothetical protein